MKEDQSFEQLRNLLLQPEQEHLEDLESQILDPDRLAEHVGRALPMAVKRGRMEGDHLARALSPLIEDAIKKSIRGNPKLLAEILFPIIGTAVRKAVAETWRNLIRTLNKVLEQRFSPRGLKWRWIAWRTGKSYAEVILAHTLVFRVEQVFLIHKETGLLLYHLGGQDNDFMEMEVVSSMFTAIQDFVHDSFRIEEESNLEVLQLGELQVWVEPGPHAYLAAVIRGEPPADLRETFQIAMEDIQFDHARELADFQGDTIHFEAVDSILQDCMVRRDRESEKGAGKIWFVAALILIPIFSWLGWFSYHRVLENRDRDRIRTLLADAPGYQLTSLRLAGETYRLEGLKDPLAKPLEEVLAEEDLSHPVTGRFTPFQSLEPSILLARLGRTIVPPGGVSLSLRDRVLVLRGRTTPLWLAEAEEKLAVLSGIDSWDISGLTAETPPDPLEELTARVEDWALYFQTNQTELDETQRSRIDAVLPTIRSLFTAAERSGKDLVLEIAGHTDHQGQQARNLQISNKRARSVVAFLVDMGIDKDRLRTVGYGSSDASDGRDPGLLRRVTLRVRVINPP